MNKRLSFVQFLAFALVGAFGTLVHYSILFIAVSIFAISPVWATAFGATAGALVNFLLNHRLTFRSKRALSKTAPQFFAVAAFGLAVNSLIMYVMTTRLEIHYFLAQLVATGTVLFLNYSLNALWTFGARYADR